MDTQDRPDPVAKARELGATIAAAADAIEVTRRIPEPLLARLHASRLLRMLLPRSVGGDQTDPGTYVLAIAEIARHDASVAWNAFVANSSALIAAFLEPPIARTIFSDPRTVVAWGPPNATRASAVAEGYRLSGTWDFASGCRNANWMGAHCHVVEADGSLRLNHLGRPAIRTLLFPAAQATLLDTWNTIGLRGTASDSYEVADIFVPEAYSTTREDPFCAASGGRSMPSRCKASMPWGWRAWLSASPGRCSMSSSAWHCERPRAPWGVSPTTRSCKRK
jgi:alkylation response protein AidB-like acyl-CoA dehydrogenase